MKRYLLFILCTFFILFYSCKRHPYKQETTQRTYAIKYVDIEDETPFRVDATTFDYCFDYNKDTVNIHLIDELIEYALGYKDRCLNKPDIRMIIKTIDNDDTIVLIGVNSIQIDDIIVCNDYYIDSLITEIYNEINRY